MLFLCDIFKEKNTKSAKSKRNCFFFCRKRRIIVTAVYVHGLVKELHRSILPKAAILTVRIDLFEVITAIVTETKYIYQF